MATSDPTIPFGRIPRNKGKLVGQKPPLKLPAIWAIRTRLQMAGKFRELALFNLAIDSKLRSCNLVRLRVPDIAHGDHVLTRASVTQQKTKQPVRFELSEQTRNAIAAWVKEAHLTPTDFLFPSRFRGSPAPFDSPVRENREILDHNDRCRSARVRDPLAATHQSHPDLSKNQESGAVQLLLGYTKLESTVRYLGIEVDDALEMAERIEC